MHAIEPDRQGCTWRVGATHASHIKGVSANGVGNFIPRELAEACADISMD